MHTLRNLTNSPYRITMADGSTEMLPARGELKGVEVHHMHIQYVRNCGYIEIIELSKVVSVEPTEPTEPVEPAEPTEPVDTGTDSDADAEVDSVEELRAEYLEVAGKHADKRWGESRLRDEIESLNELD